MPSGVAHFATAGNAVTRHDAEQQVFTDIRCHGCVAGGACATNIRRIAALVVVRTHPTEAAAAFRVVFCIAVGVRGDKDLVSFQRAADGDIRCCGR